MMRHDNPEPTGPSRGSLIALVAVIGLIAFGWWLQQRIHANSILEDCLMAGRKNCAPITTTN